MTMGIVSCVEVLSCSYYVSIMLLKAFDYAMIMGIVSIFEVGEYDQLGTSCAFESPTLANEMSLRGVQCVCRLNPVWV